MENQVEMFRKKRHTQKLWCMIAIMQEKEESSKIKGTISNFPIESTYICNVVPRPADSNAGFVQLPRKKIPWLPSNFHDFSPT